jgi:hypothetical protein
MKKKKIVVKNLGIYDENSQKLVFKEAYVIK